MEDMKMVSSFGGLSCESAPVLENESRTQAEGTVPEEVPGQSAEEKRPFHADGKDRLFAWLYLLVGYGFIYTFSSVYFEKNLAFYTVFYIAVVWGYVLKKGIHPRRESYFWMGVLLAVAIPYAFFSVMPFLQVVAVIFLAAYWTLNMTGSFLEEFRTSQWVAADSLNALIIVPFANFTSHFKVLWGSCRRGKGENETAGKLGSVILGLVIAIPLLMIVLPLLSSADAGFQYLAADVFAYVEEHLLFTLLRILLSIPVAAYLFGLVYGGIHKQNTGWIDREKVRKIGKDIHVLPDTATVTAVLAVCVFYVLFMAIQGKYLFSAFWGMMPQNFTYAEYARRGFFELCGIAFFNLILLLGANLFAQTKRKESHLLRVINVLLAVLTLLLIFTAMSKMGMYIAVYGLTVKRILTMAFMIWLTIVFSLTIVWQRRELPIIRICTIAGAVIFCMLCIIPIQKL